MQWAIVNGEKKLGLTVHYVNKKIDSGPIIAKGILEIKNLDTLNTLKQKIQLLIFSIIRTKLYSFRYNKFYSLKQDLKKELFGEKEQNLIRKSYGQSIQTLKYLVLLEQ